MPQVIDLTSDSPTNISSDGESSPVASRRDKSHRNQHSSANLFYIDIQPHAAPESASQSATVGVTQQGTNDDSEVKLLLPAHVSVVGSVPVEVLPPASDDEDYIEYLDYGGPNELNIPRYFNTEADKPTTPSIIVCKRCGAKGEHKTNACPVIICLTCGVRNEHSTNSCPISKVCFACGMKGHLNASCPNRGTLANSYDDCERCGASNHATNECPTLWRLYQYVTEDDRISTLKARREKKLLPLGEGGEGYIAEDSWCYNCGDSGHWGDDCDVTAHVGDIPQDWSAFSSNNLLSGPFYDVETVATSRPLREWEQDGPQWQDWGGRVPMGVGRRGKAKEMAQLRARQEEDEDDADDFFARSVKGRSSGNGRQPPLQPKKMGISLKGAASASLLSRISDMSAAGDARTRADADVHDRDRGRDKKRKRDKDRDRNGGKGREKELDDSKNWDRNRGRGRDGDWSRDKDRRRDQDRYGDRDRGRAREDQRGPRYKGGYAR